MSHIVLSGDDKKLTIKTLDFWQKVIDVFLKQRGALDGQFPEATFCKELKRIIQFDKITIKKCIQDILNNLSKIGCLTVFVHILTKQSDIELKNIAQNYLEHFISLIKKYNIIPSTDSDILTKCLSPISTLEDFEDNLFSSPLSPTALLSYLESTDTSFPQSFSTYMEDSCNNNNSVLKCNEIITTNDFLKLVYQDFSGTNTRFDSKDNFDNILDQILSNSTI